MARVGFFKTSDDLPVECGWGMKLELVVYDQKDLDAARRAICFALARLKINASGIPIESLKHHIKTNPKG